MLLAIPPRATLARFVRCCCFVEDIAGERAGVVIETCPNPGSVLTINVGRPNSIAGGPITPAVSFFGPQTKTRKWLSGLDTYFLMIFLTIDGLVRLFPRDGALAADNLADLGSLIGDRAAGRLAGDVAAAPNPRRLRRRRPLTPQGPMRAIGAAS